MPPRLGGREEPPLSDLWEAPPFQMCAEPPSSDMGAGAVLTGEMLVGDPAPPYGAGCDLEVGNVERGRHPPNMMEERDVTIRW